MEQTKENEVRRVMVTDGDGIPCGVIAQADLLCLEGEEHPRRVEKVLAAISEPAGRPV